MTLPSLEKVFEKEQRAIAVEKAVKESGWAVIDGIPKRPRKRSAKKPRPAKEKITPSQFARLMSELEEFKEDIAELKEFLTALLVKKKETD